MGQRRHRGAHGSGRERGPAEPEIVSGLEILRWAHGADGVGVPEGGALAGRIVFVPDVVPGDVVDVAIVEAKERWARGTVARVVTPSPERVQVPCIVQGRCGGCPWMPGSAAVQATSRRRILEGELKKRLALSDLDLAARLVMRESPARLGYRQRVRLTFEVAMSPEGPVVRLGFLGKKSHALVDIDRCEVADERINAALGAVRAELATLGAGAGGRVTLVAGEGGVAGHVEARDGRERDFGPAQVRVDLGDYTQSLSPRAFAQANGAVTGQMLATLEGWARAARLETLADPWAVELFAGAGTLTMALWRAGWRVTAYEAAAAARAGFEATRAACGVAPERGVWHAADLGLGLPWPTPPAPALIVLDPPRTGAADVMTWVRASGARQVAYISCDLATGLRDLQVLTADARFRIEQVVGLDMFPHAGHQEVMVLAVAGSAAD